MRLPKAGADWLARIGSARSAETKVREWNFGNGAVRSMPATASINGRVTELLRLDAQLMSGDAKCASLPLRSISASCCWVKFVLPCFASTARATAFFDFGDVAFRGNTQFLDKGGFPVNYAFSPRNFVTSVGLGVQWLAPLGLFKFSYAIPLKYHHDSELNYGDDVEHFQFSIGQAF